MTNPEIQKILDQQARHLHDDDLRLIQGQVWPDDVKIVLFEHRLTDSAYRNGTLVQTRLQVEAPESSAGLIVKSRWEK